MLVWVLGGGYDDAEQAGGGLRSEVTGSTVSLECDVICMSVVQVDYTAMPHGTVGFASLPPSDVEVRSSQSFRSLSIKAINHLMSPWSLTH